MKKLIFTLALGLVLLNVNCAKALEVVDVNNDYWAANQIINVINKGYMSLKEANKFLPEGEISRSEFVHNLLKVIQSEDAEADIHSKFKDVNTQTPNLNSILTSEQLKYIFGYPDGTFKPENSILRSEANAVVANMSKGFYGDMTVLNRYADKDEIPNWALYSYIKNTVNKLIVNYPDKNILSPNTYLTRAQTAALLTKVEQNLALIEEKFKRANKVPSELLSTNTLGLVESAPRNVVNVYNTKIVVEAGNVIVANPVETIKSKNLQMRDQVVFEAPADVYTQEGTFVYPAGTKFIADVQDEAYTPFRHKKQKDLLVVRKIITPQGISHEMAGVAYTTDNGRVVTQNSINKNPIKENYFEGRKEITKAEFLVKYADKLAPVVKYDLNTKDTIYILLTGDLVIPNELYWEFEPKDIL